MKKLIMVAALVIGLITIGTVRKGFEICVYPNPCSVTVAQFQPCVWPNPCGK